MPGDLSFRQRLVGMDGRATGRAKAGLAAVVAVAFGAGFLLAPGDRATPPPVAASTIEGEVATASGGSADAAVGIPSRLTATAPISRKRPLCLMLLLRCGAGPGRRGPAA